MKTFTYVKTELGIALFKGISARMKTKMGGLSLNSAPTIDSKDAESKYRAPGTIQKPKLSALAQLVDDIYLGKVSVYTVASDIIIEIRHTTKPAFFGKVSGFGKLTVEDAAAVTPRDADFAAALSRSLDASSESGSALREYFEKCESGYKSDPSIYRFCDSFYYGFIVLGGSVTVEEDKALKEEFKSALTGGMVEFQSYGIPQMQDVYKAGDYVEAPLVSEKEEEVTGEDSIEEFLEECKSGKYRIEYDWTEEQKTHIRPLSILEGFQPTQEFKEVVLKVYRRMTKNLGRKASGTPFTDRFAYGKDDVNIMLVGKPGTGKSYLAERAAAALQMPYICLSLSKNSEEDVYKGMTLIVDGKPQFVETDFSKFFDQGMFCVLEEPNLAPADVNMALAKALDESGALIVDGRGTKYRSPLTVICACENTGIEGTKLNSPAFSNRFRSTWTMPDPTEDDFKGMLVKSTGQPKSLVNWVYKVYRNTVNWLKSPKIGADDVANFLSIRTCEGLIENLQDGMSDRRAIEASIVGSVAEVDAELAEQLKQEVIDDLPACPTKARF